MNDLIHLDFPVQTVGPPNPNVPLTPGAWSMDPQPTSMSMPHMQVAPIMSQSSVVPKTALHSQPVAVDLLGLDTQVWVISFQAKPLHHFRRWTDRQVIIPLGIDLRPLDLSSPQGGPGFRSTLVIMHLPQSIQHRRMDAGPQVEQECLIVPRPLLLLRGYLRNSSAGLSHIPNLWFRPG